MFSLTKFGKNILTTADECEIDSVPVLIMTPLKYFKIKSMNC